jgi:cytochrome c biogenesis protein CcmG, thiol:disulfide interchange protein DsbE
VKRFLIPIGIFVALGLLLGYGLSLDPRKIPSPLVGKPLPEFAMPTLADPQRTVTRQALLGRVYLLNIWASWCAACRDEHPILNDLAMRRVVPIIGLNYKDSPTDAVNWLARLGAPYESNLFDGDGRFGIELGVYGVPETFVIDRNGVIRDKIIGPVSPVIVDQRLLPLLARLKSEADGTLAR